MQILAFLLTYSGFLGCAAAVVWSALRWQFVPADRRRAEWFLLASIGAVVAPMACQAFTSRASAIVPLKLDQFLFILDGPLHPSFALGRFCAGHPWLRLSASTAYGALSAAMLAVFGFCLWRGSSADALTVARTFLLNLVLAVPFYLLIPVCGPAYAFSGFPFRAPAGLIPHRIALAAPPNGMPSVHMSTALLVLWFAWPSKVGRALALGYAALIVVSTLGNGEHYLLDLIAAVPYTALILRLGKIEWSRGNNMLDEPPTDRRPAMNHFEPAAQVW